MSYTEYAGHEGLRPSSLMMLDYLALKEKDLLATVFNNQAHTKYFWSNPVLNTIFDTDGDHDFISAEGHKAGSIIDLRGGHFSSYGQGTDGRTLVENLAIFWDSVIEDAIGSDNNDVLIGNDVGNELRGGKGDDFLYGSGLNYKTKDWKFSADHKAAYAATVDTELSVVDDKDTLYGGEGNDYIDGQSGNDNLYGDEGNDEIYGDLGDDLLEGGAGQDHLYGGDGSFSIHDGNDSLKGGEGDDILEGGTGNDTYLFDGDFGFDRVIDADSKGSIVFGGTTVGILKVVSGAEGIYRDNLTSPTIEAILIRDGDSQSLLITKIGDVENSGRILIENWQTNGLGITLDNKVEEVDTSTMLTLNGNDGSNYLNREKIRFTPIITNFSYYKYF